MKKVLIVVDMQNDFIDGSLGSPQAEKTVSEAVKVIERDEWDEVCVTYDTHTENYLSTHEGKYLPVEHCIRGTDGWKLNIRIKEALEKKECMTVFEKPTFGSEKLAVYMKEKKPDEITLCGLCTDICVISNALLLRAALPETEISVYEPACAGVSEESHEAAITVMKSCQIKIEK